MLGLVPAIGQPVLVLSTGRTLGEVVVRLRPIPRPGVIHGVVRWMVGIGGWTLLGALNQSFRQELLTLAAVVGVLPTGDRRGLGAAAAGLRVVDDRVPETAHRWQQPSGGDVLHG